MIPLALRSLLLLVFGVGLFFLWRAAEPSERRLKWIVAAGFLARAILGQALFWISWMRLPLLRSLQTGDGYWLFAQDATFYFPKAVAAADNGLRAIIFLDRGSASVSYVQLLAGMIALLGSATSVGILLNLFCYLGTIALLVRWERAEPPTHTAVAVAITAISLSPSLVLWSLQPLKDSMFQLLFVAFVAGCAAWQRGTWQTRISTGVLLVVVLFLLAGIRWYFAGALVVATLLFLLIIAFTAAGRKAISFGAAAVMIVVLTQSLVLSARANIPRSLMTLSFRQVPAAIEQVRRGFDTTPASTMIRSGHSTIAVTPPPAPSRQFTDADAMRIRALLDAQVAAWNHCDVARAMDFYWRSPDLEVVDGSSVIRGWDRAAAEHGRNCRTVDRLRVTDLRLTGAGDTATLSGRWEATKGSIQRLTPFTMTLRRFPNGDWKIVREVFHLPPVAAAKAAPPPEESPRERLLAGAAALVFPRILGERLGLFEISGGRGLLWFAEIDTLIFDVVLLFALWAVVARAARAWRNPLTWLVLLTMLIVLVPLVYSVSNFGTLFRLREMIFLGLLLIPIAARESRPVTRGPRWQLAVDSWP